MQAQSTAPELSSWVLAGHTSHSLLDAKALKNPGRHSENTNRTETASGADDPRGGGNITESGCRPKDNPSEPFITDTRVDLRALRESGC